MYIQYPLLGTERSETFSFYKINEFGWTFTKYVGQFVIIDDSNLTLNNVYL